jgi:hypothetical protein
MNHLAVDAFDSIFKSQDSFQVVLQHWAKARIDTPLQLVARFDDAAKQLIAIGGMIQGLMIAVFAFSGASPRIPAWGILVIVGLLLLFIFCAARVICTLPPELEAMKAYKLFKIGTAGVADEELESAIYTWCHEIKVLITKKHWWLRSANILFLVSSAVAISLVVWHMMPR